MGWTVRSWHRADDITELKVRCERGTDITNSILCESPGSRSAPLLYIIANDDKYNYISLCPYLLDKIVEVSRK